MATDLSRNSWTQAIRFVCLAEPCEVNAECCLSCSTGWTIDLDEAGRSERSSGFGFDDGVGELRQFDWARRLLLCNAGSLANG